MIASQSLWSLSYRSFWLVSSLLLLAPVRSHAQSPAMDQGLIEQDWLLQDVTRHLTGSALPRWTGTNSTKEDAQGGCDGVKDGTYGFHTGEDENPWWQVDLGKPTEIERVVVYNRCDGNVQGRALKISVAISANGTEWTTAYQHSGEFFGGVPDGKPLSAPLNGASARWVRMQLPTKGYLHLDEVEVYARGSDANVAIGMKADQSSVSGWSKTRKTQSGVPAPVAEAPEYHVREAIQRGLLLAMHLSLQGVDVSEEIRALELIANQADPSDTAQRREIYLRTRQLVRSMALEEPPSGL